MRTVKNLTVNSSSLIHQAAELHTRLKSLAAENAAAADAMVFLAKMAAEIRKLETQVEETKKELIAEDAKSFSASINNDMLLATLIDLLKCPYVIDEATIPKAGINAALPYQVVGTLHVAHTRMRNARELVAKLKS